MTGSVRARWLAATGRQLVHPAVAVVLTWPAVAHLGSAVPRGTESASTVPLFNLWTLQWNVERVGHGWSGYWDAPTFWPGTGSFARSDPQPLTGLVAWSLSWLPGGTTTAYLLVLLGALTLNGIVAAHVARRLGASELGAVVAGVIVQASPFVANELGVIQLAMLFGGLLALDGVVGVAMDGPGRRDGVLVGGGLAVAALTNGYLALALATVLGPIVAVLLARSRAPRAIAGFAVAVIVPVLVAAPFVLGQQAATDDDGWPREVVASNSAALADLVQLDDQLVGGAVLPWAENSSGTAQRLWPGALVLGLGLLGLVEARARSTTRRAAMVLAVVAGFGALACLGLRLDIGGFAPYALLYDHVPGWDRLRSPFRLVVLVTLALGPLVGLGFDRLAGLLRGRSHGRLGTVALCIVILVGLIEVWPRERPLVEVPDVAHQDWVAFLAAADDGEPVAHVPAADPRGRVEDFEPTVVDMLASLEHGHPMLSGYTGLFPPHATVARRRLQSPVDEEVVDLLCLRGVPWVVVDDGLVADDRRLEPAFDGIARDVYRVDCEP